MDVNFLRARSYLYIDQYSKALEDCESEIRLNPQMTRGYHLRSLVHHKMKKYDLAIADSDQAIRIDPKESILYYRRGNSRLEVKEYEKAIADFETTLQIDPNSAPAMDRQAWILATCPIDSMRDGKKALMLANKALEASKGKQEAYYLSTLAAAYAESGDFEKAVEVQTRSLKLFEESDGVKSEADLKEIAFANKNLAIYREKRPLRAVPEE
jgi:tetratricopeptide (TPR) repeat protein